MSSDKNRMFALARRAEGLPKEDDFEYREAPIAEVGAGEVQIRSAYVSVDPYFRMMMNPAGKPLGAVFGGEAVGTVEYSRHPGFQPGDAVFGYWGWQTRPVFPGDKLLKLELGSLPLRTALGAVGMPGLTAYFGLLDIGRPQPGETVAVSAAAGAVGSVVGQIALLKGARVIGMAGSDEKTAHVTQDLGFHGAVNYKSSRNLTDDLSKLTPDGVDVYFDNVGGWISEAVFPLLNRKARVPVCGQISQYNTTRPEPGVRVGPILLGKSALMQGFGVDNYKERFPEARKQLVQWVEQGQIKPREQVVEGLANTPRTFIGLFRGENIGKLMVHVEHDG